MRKIITNRNLRQKVFEKVRDIVVSDETQAGSKIDEYKIAKALGVSKTPVREALSKLAHEGLVNIVPNRGSFKVELSEKDILDVMAIREVLEALCIRLAAINLTRGEIQKMRAIFEDFEVRELEKEFSYYSGALQEFYSILYSSTKNKRLVRFIQSMDDLTNVFRAFYFSDAERVRHSITLHRELIEALERKDIDLAEKMRKDMVRSAYAYLLETAAESRISHPPGKVVQRLPILGY
jgi:DNA-binding GntR family transcriptional regulator